MTTISELATRSIRSIAYKFLLAPTRDIDDSREVARWDEFSWDDGSLWSPDDTYVIQAWDYFNYIDYTKYLQEISIDRKAIDGLVTTGIADVTLVNTGRFAYGQDAARPKRAFQIMGGFENQTTRRFIGVTEGAPDIDSGTNEVTLTAYDMLGEFLDAPLEQLQVYVDKRTDEVLEGLLTAAGISNSAYVLESAANRIPFVFFPQGKSIREVVGLIIEAEGGRLWLDAGGIIRFRSRAPRITSSVKTLTDININTLKHVEGNMVNHVTVLIDPYVVQPYQPIYEKTSQDTRVDGIPASSVATIPFALESPAAVIVEPVFGENAGVSWFTALSAGGTRISSNISIIDTELTANSYNITFQNNNTQTVNIDQLVLYGQPAVKIFVEPEVVIVKDQDSIDANGLFPKEISSEMILGVEFGDGLGRSLITNSADKTAGMELQVKADWTLDLDDVVVVDSLRHDVYGIFKIAGTNERLSLGNLNQTIIVYPYDPVAWARWDEFDWDEALWV